LNPVNLLINLMSWDFDEPVARENTNCVKYDLRKEVFGAADIIPMWVADMDFKTPGFIIDALKRRLGHEIMGYSFRPPAFCNSIVKWQQTRHNWKIEKEWICYSPGVVPSLNLCTLAFTRPGDSVIVQPPVYFPFFSAVENHGRNLVYNQLKEEDGRWTMDFDALSASIDESTKMIIISNPHNPVGRVWSDEELLRLTSICLEKNIIILSDEIHCDLLLPGYSHLPVAKISDHIADITVTCIAPSKTFNLAGLSTSSVIISNPVLRKYFVSKIEHLSLGGGNIFGAEASVAAYSEGAEWLDELMKYINGNVDYVIDYLNQLIPEIIPVRPEATYMIWLDCRQMGMKGKELQNFFVNRAKVGMNEGSTFGPGGEGFMRMNLATTREKVKRAMEQIEKAISSIR
jgi:cystathionine beta-lyase